MSIERSTESVPTRPSSFPHECMLDFRAQHSSCSLGFQVVRPTLMYCLESLLRNTPARILKKTRKRNKTEGHSSQVLVRSAGECRHELSRAEPRAADSYRRLLSYTAGLQMKTTLFTSSPQTAVNETRARGQRRCNFVNIADY